MAVLNAVFLALLGILASHAMLYGQIGSPAEEDIGTPSLLETSLIQPGSIGELSGLPPPLPDDSDSDAPLIGAVIGAAAGAVVSILISERATGSSVVLPLLVLGGVLIGYGVGTAF